MKKKRELLFMRPFSQKARKREKARFIRLAKKKIGKVATLIQEVYAEAGTNKSEEGMLVSLRALLDGEISIEAHKKTDTWLVTRFEGPQSLHIPERMLLGILCSDWEIAAILVHELSHSYWDRCGRWAETLEDLVEGEAFAVEMEINFVIKAEDRIGDIRANQKRLRHLEYLLRQYILHETDINKWYELLEDLTLASNPTAQFLPRRAA